MRVELKGVHTVKAKGSTYHYAWRGGPRLRGEPGSSEFHASYNAAIEERRTPEPGRFTALVTAYKASSDYRKLAESTRAQWSRWLARISEHFGELRIAQFDRPEKIRAVIRRWRNQWADTPRTADYGMQVLSRVLSYAVDPLGKLAGNACDGIKQLYTNDRSKLIWTEADLAPLQKSCPAEIANAVDLAVCSGLRLGDLVRLSWSHVGEDAITIATGKSRGQREALIPLYDDLRDVLARIPKWSPIILTNSLGQPWKTNALSKAFGRAREGSGMAECGLTFHDLRGTAATRFYVAGLSTR